MRYLQHTQDNTTAPRNLVWLIGAGLTLCSGSPCVAQETGVAHDASVATTPVYRPDKQAVHERLAAGYRRKNRISSSSGTPSWRISRGRAKRFRDRRYAARNAFSLAVSDDLIQHVLWRLDHGELDNISPRLAVVQIGANNVGNTTPDDIASGVAAIVGRVRAKLPDTRILLMGLFPQGEKPDIRSVLLLTG